MRVLILGFVQFCPGAFKVCGALHRVYNGLVFRGGLGVCTRVLRSVKDFRECYKVLVFRRSHSDNPSEACLGFKLKRLFLLSIPNPPLVQRPTPNKSAPQ